MSEYTTYLVKKPFLVGDEPPKPGIYSVRDALAPYDPELPKPFLQLYEHPEMGLVFWDESGGDGDHVPWHFLKGEEISPVETI